MQKIRDVFFSTFNNIPVTRRDIFASCAVIIISFFILLSIVLNGVFGVNTKPAIVSSRVRIGELEFAFLTSGQGQDILCLHDFAEGSNAFSEMIPLLNTEFKLSVPEMRGVNGSDKPRSVEDYELSKLVLDVVQFINVLMQRNGNRRVFLFGHGFGGLIAQIVASTHPENLKGLILANAPHPNALQYLWRNSETQRAANQFYLDALKINSTSDGLDLFNSMTQSPYFQNNPGPYLKAWNQPWAVNSTLQWFKANFFGENLKIIKTNFPCCINIEIPTLSIWGTQDTMYLYKEHVDLLAPFFTVHQIKELPQFGHWILHDDPREVSDMVKQFIRKL